MKLCSDQKMFLDFVNRFGNEKALCLAAKLGLQVSREESAKGPPRPAKDKNPGRLVREVGFKL
jgi:hypothetical protein